MEHIWQADKAVWGFHGPILFPNCGKLVDGKLEAKGKVYEGSMHGFARDMEHDFVDQTGDSLVLELCSNAETLARFPYEFRLVSTFTLENDTLHHSLTVENLDSDRLPFGIGYHPGYTVPFDDQHVATDYELRFSELESPICIDHLPAGLNHGNYYRLGANIRSIPVDENLFANDSHCMVNLKSATLGLYEKGTGRAVVCNIAEFPYVLLWSKPGMPNSCALSPGTACPAPRAAPSSGKKSPLLPS